MVCFKRIVLAGVLVLIGLVSAAGRGYGWSSGGHRVVANIAYDRLDKPLRTKIVSVLREHEAFQKYFEDHMPDGLTAEDQDRWIFLQAAIFPDLARHTRFDRDKWHYVNFPYYPIEGDEVALKGQINPNLSDKLPATITDNVSRTFNCMQAFKFAQGKITDSHNEPKEKAFYYCFLIHISGDVHQPLHSTSLVTRARFSESFGDTGGHLPIVPIGKSNIARKKATSLHAFWDGLHGEIQDESNSLEQIVKRGAMILAEDANRKAGERALKDLNIKTWVMESHKIAKEFAYTKKMVQIVEMGEMNAPRALPPIDLKMIDGYQEQAQTIANQRVSEAGYRLAEILKALN